MTSYKEITIAKPEANIPKKTKPEANKNYSKKH